MLFRNGAQEVLKSHAHFINPSTVHQQVNTVNQILFFCMQWGASEGRRGRRGHSLQSCEKSLVRGKVKVGEAGLVTTAGAELMPLDTTEDAGTWRARKSAPGLVGSSVGGWREGEGGRGRQEERRRWKRRRRRRKEREDRVRC